MPGERGVKEGVKNPIGARDIIEQMEREFGVPIRAGRLRGRNLRGVYKRIWMNARVKRDESGSVDVAAHEVAHGIDHRTDLLSGLPKNAAPVALDTNAVHYGNLLVTGTTGGCVRDYRIAMKLVAGGRVDLRQVVSDVFPLCQLRQAYDRALSGAEGKVILVEEAL